MLTSGIDFINFNVKKHLSLVKENLISIIKSKNEIVNSLSQNYKNSFSKKILSKYKKECQIIVLLVWVALHLELKQYTIF